MFILGKLKMYAALIGAAVLAVGMAFLKGRRAGIKEKEHEELEEYVETRERMDEADVMSDPDDAREWLRNRDKS